MDQVSNTHPHHDVVSPNSSSERPPRSASLLDTTTPVSTVRDLLQSSLGNAYTLEHELAGGGMSHVFVAREIALGRQVVVKVLPPEMAASVSMERFKREITLAARLQHPHIVPLLNAGEAGGLPWFSMPFVEGESLRAHLAHATPSLHDTLEILRDVALALEYAHARDVVHRDIKPENILLTGRTAVVMDFGIARAITAASDVHDSATLTALGTIVGTPAYMAPEQAAGEVAGPAADIYAWGLVAYEMLAGAHPFASRTAAQALLAAHIAERPAPLGSLQKDLPSALTALVDQCLAKDPADRPAGAAAILAQLGALALASPARGLRRAPLIGTAALIVALLAGSLAWVWRGSEQRRWAREDALPAARQLASDDRALAAFLVLQRAVALVPTDTAVVHALETSEDTVSIATSPPGATIAVRDYVTPDSAWHVVGVTPVTNALLPHGYFRWRISKAGVGDYVTAPKTDREMRFPLDSAMHAPPGMVYVSGNTWGDMIAFMGWVGPFRLPSFLMDRYEVTNREYQAFVDQGGYEQPLYWADSFTLHGHSLARDSAMRLFLDRTGRPGPSTWEGGRYPAGRADYPVSGVSWYEASAYAAFAGKSLPAVAQWYLAAPPELARFTVRVSNISHTDLAPVGAFNGLGPFGTFDMAGNVAEWTVNALDADRRYILGGDWRAQSYLFDDADARAAFDRSPANGIRCVRNVVPLPPAVSAPSKALERNFASFTPASDAVFAAYRHMYAYVPGPLNAKVDSAVENARDWRKERITLDAAYSGERLSAYLFLPKNVKPPYQTIVFFPSARVLQLTNSRSLGDTAYFDYIVQSGRAVLYPVYQDTYERRFRRGLPGANQAIDLSIQRSRDLGRSLDYLDTRPDIAHDRIAYLGVSMGSAEGVMYATLAQDRLATVVFLDGGYFLGKAPPGGDQADFAPRMKKPVLMVNGRYDFTFSYEKSQLPFFRMLGTPDSSKRHVVLETPHDVLALRPALVSAVLGWLDRYLGVVR